MPAGSLASTTNGVSLRSGRASALLLPLAFWAGLDSSLALSLGRSAFEYLGLGPLDPARGRAAAVWGSGTRVVAVGCWGVVPVRRNLGKLRQLHATLRLERGRWRGAEPAQRGMGRLPSHARQRDPALAAQPGQLGLVALDLPSSKGPKLSGRLKGHRISNLTASSEASALHLCFVFG